MHTQLPPSPPCWTNAWYVCFRRYNWRCNTGSVRATKCVALRAANTPLIWKCTYVVQILETVECITLACTCTIFNKIVHNSHVEPMHRKKIMPRTDRRFRMINILFYFISFILIYIIPLPITLFCLNKLIHRNQNSEAIYT